jgi:hypothetical protein
LRQALPAERRQPVNPGAEINRLNSEKDPALGRQLRALPVSVRDI